MPKKKNLFLDTQNENSAIEVMLLRTQSPIKLSNKLWAGREQKAQNLTILYTTERSSFLFSSLHILSNVFVKRQHWKKNIEKRQQTKEFYQKERWHKQTGCYNESSMTSIVGIMKANQGCSLQVMKSHRIYIQSHGYRNRPVRPDWPDLSLVWPSKHSFWHP